MANAQSKRNSSPAGTPLVERFWKYVQKTDGCWLWTGSANGHGYGQLSKPDEGGKRMRPFAAHRLSYEIHSGVIPAGLYVCHRCDNPPCVNPAHLFLGTAKDNMVDARDKGRMRGPRLVGRQQSQAKLTEDAVREIRAVYARRSGAKVPDGTRVSLARKFGVSVNLISHVAAGIDWRHVK